MGRPFLLGHPVLLYRMYRSTVVLFFNIVQRQILFSSTFDSSSSSSDKCDGRGKFVLLSPFFLEFAREEKGEEGRSFLRSFFFLCFPDSAARLGRQRIKRMPTVNTKFRYKKSRLPSCMYGTCFYLNYASLAASSGAPSGNAVLRCHEEERS